MAMTESDIVRAIRTRSTTLSPAEEASLPTPDLENATFGQMFVDMNAGPTGIRRTHVTDALRNIWAWDAHERQGIVTYLVLARVRWPTEHTLLVMAHQYGAKPPSVEWAWRLFGPVPQDPTQAFAHLIARYGLVVLAGDVRALFHADLVVPDGVPLSTEGTGKSTLSAFVRRLGGGINEYSWVFALSDFDYARDEERARKAAPRMASIGPQYEPPLERLPEAAVVVRGGVMLVSDLQKTAEVNQHKYGYPGISVWADVGATSLHEVVARAPVPHPKVRWTTAKRVRDAGLELRKCGPPYHYDLVVPDTTEATLATIADLFAGPVENPLPRQI